jgi:hypothetical protein
MFTHVCPLTGHKRKFASGRDAKRWLKEQQAKYVPTLAEDIKASREATLGVGLTKATPKLKRQARFSECSSGKSTYGMVSHVSPDRTISVKKDGVWVTMRIKGGPVVGNKVRFTE